MERENDMTERIREYAGLMHELDLSALEMTEGDRTLRLERGGAAATVVAAAAPAVVTAEPATDGSGVFPSPMVGVFYRAPAENASPFVNVGDRVREGDVMCIIEAMKLMNEITSDRDGVITEVCVSDGQVVDFGCPLFHIREE